jgi:hypothetical protein
MTDEELLEQIKASSPELIALIEAMLQNSTREHLISKGLSVPRSKVSAQDVISIIKSVCKVVTPLCKIMEDV